MKIENRKKEWKNQQKKKQYRNRQKSQQEKKQRRDRQESKQEKDQHRDRQENQQEKKQHKNRKENQQEKNQHKTQHEKQRKNRCCYPRHIFGGFLIAVGLALYLYPAVHEKILSDQVQNVIESFRERFGITEGGESEANANRNGTNGSAEKTADETAGVSVDGDAEEEEVTIYAVKDNSAESLLQEELEELYKACFSYNCRIYAAAQADLKDTESYEKLELASETASGLLSDDMFGYIEIPAMDVLLPLYLGASTAHMAAGAAVLGETSVPIGGLNTNAVISGHRGYRGSPYFREIEKLVVGDRVYVTNPWETLVYEVSEIDIISPQDVEAIKIQEGRDMITLLTCHPYRSGGKYRYVVYCDRVQEEASAEDTTSAVANNSGEAAKTNGAGTADDTAFESTKSKYIVASDGTVYASSEQDIRAEQILRWGGGIFLLTLLLFFLIRAFLRSCLGRISRFL